MRSIAKKSLAAAVFLLTSSLLAVSWLFAGANEAGAAFTGSWQDLAITSSSVYWGSYADYRARELTVEITIHNNSGSSTARNVAVTGASCGSGVTLVSATPVVVGDIAAGGDGSASLKFNIPPGVSNFRTNITGSADGPGPLNPDPPATPVKLVFVHHSTGENWITDGDGNLGSSLTAANYFVSDTNYGWGPADADAGYGTIGDHTDIGHWYSWFAGPYAGTYTAALYAEYGQHSSYTRMATDSGGTNEIIMFKSCYPNSALGGNPGDPATVGANPLRGQDAGSGDMTVGNVKGIYNDLLPYFAAHQEKLFIVVTAPPLQSSDTNASQAANARAFNNWLVNDWLAGYAYNNIAVFDFYNVLTSNGGSADVNDLGAPGGNHHRYNAVSGEIEHLTGGGSNYSAYPGGNGGGSHPTAAGGQKASGEFVTWLNVMYNRWKGL